MQMVKLTKKKNYRRGILLFKIGSAGVLSILVYLNISKFIKLIELFLIELYFDILSMPLTSKLIAVFTIIGIIGLLICIITQEIETTDVEDTGVNQ